jgi:HK97 family phage portal protein
MMPAAPAPLERARIDYLMQAGIQRQTLGYSPDKAMGLPALFSVVRLIASTITQLDVQVRSDSDPKWLYRPRTEGGALDLGDLLQFTVTSMCLYGHGDLQVVRRSDDSWQLDALHPTSVQCQPSTSGVVRLEYRVDGVPIERVPATLSKASIAQPYLLTVPYLVTPGKPMGTSPVVDAWDAFVGYLDVQQQASSLLQSGLHSGGILETDHEITADTARRFQESWLESSLHNRVRVLGNGLRYRSETISPKDAMWLESRLFDMQSCCAMFGVPPDLLGLTLAGGSSSLSYANRQDNNRSFRAQCLEAITTQLEASFSLLLGPGRNVAESRNFTFDWTKWEGAQDGDQNQASDPQQ